MRLIVLLLLATTAYGQAPMVISRLTTLNQRGVYQIRETTNGVAFSVFTLSLPTNSCGSIVADFSAESSAGTQRAVQSGQIRLVAMNVGGVITADQNTIGLVELDTGGSLVMTPGNIKTSTNVTLTVTLTDATRTNRVYNYRVANLDTNIIAAPYGLPLVP